MPPARADRHAAQHSRRLPYPSKRDTRTSGLSGGHTWPEHDPAPHYRADAHTNFYLYRLFSRGLGPDPFSYTVLLCHALTINTYSGLA